MSSGDQEQAAKDQVTPGSGIQGGPPSFPSFPEVRINGLKVPPTFDAEWIEKIKDMKLRPDDVWIVTYPKCGTTWTQQIVRLILNRGKDDGLNLENAVPWVEGFCEIPGIRTYRVDLDKMSYPRAFKSHFPYELMPCGLPSLTPGKYIHVVRNPRDVAVSYFHHYNAIPIYPTLEWDEYFEKFLKGDVDFGDYFDHVLSWWVHKDDKNMLFLSYEDMKKDLPSAVAKIAKFIGQDLSQDLVDEIAHRTTFANMKRDSSANYKWIYKHRKPSSTEFMRKGEVGDWKNYFSPEQVVKLDEVCDKRTKDTGLNLEYC